MNVKCELDLEEDPLPDDDDLNVLCFWQKIRKYPTLRKIARAILAIPISTVASESAFSMGGMVISPHRSKLHAKTVEALMCLQNWIIDDVKGNFFCTFLKIGWKGHYSLFIELLYFLSTFCSRVKKITCVFSFVSQR